MITVQKVLDTVLDKAAKISASTLLRVANDPKKTFGLESVYFGVVDSVVKDFTSTNRSGEQIAKKSCTIVPFQTCLEAKHKSNDIDVGFGATNITFVTPTTMKEAAKLRPGDVVTLQTQVSSRWISEAALPKGGYFSTQIVVATPPVKHFSIPDYNCSETRRKLYLASKGSKASASSSSFTTPSKPTPFDTKSLIGDIVDDADESDYEFDNEEIAF